MYNPYRIDFVPGARAHRTARLVTARRGDRPRRRRDAAAAEPHARIAPDDCSM